MKSTTNSVYFPSSWDIQNNRLSHVGTQFNANTHGVGRALFGDWGELGNVAVTSYTDHARMNKQFEMNASYEYSSVPYYCNEDSLKIDVDMGTNNNLFIAHREASLNKLNHIRQITHKGIKKKNMAACQKYVENVNKGVSNALLAAQAQKCASVPMRYASDIYSSLLSENSIMQACQTSSSMYSGGCIKLFVLGEMTLVARCVGQKLGALRIEEYNNGEGNVKTLFESVESSTIYEIDARVNDDYCVLLVRRVREMRIYLIKNDFCGVTVTDIGVAKKNKSDMAWRCGRLSSQWNDEVMMTSDSRMCTYDLSTMSRSWQMTVPSLSPSVDTDSWNDVQALLPMQWIHTTRSRSTIIDCRQSSVCAINQLYAAASDCSLAKFETFCHTTKVFKDNYLYLMSSFNGTLIDVRMPGSAVSQWTVPLLNPVSYSSVTVNSAHSIQFVFGCQMRSSHCIFDHHSTTLAKTTCLNSMEVSPSSDMSLGLTTHRDKRGVTTVLTLDSKARLFCHQYQSALRPPHHDDTIRRRKRLVEDAVTAFALSKNNFMEDFSIDRDYRIMDRSEEQCKADRARVSAQLFKCLPGRD